MRPCQISTFGRPESFIELTNAELEELATDDNSELADFTLRGIEESKFQQDQLQISCPDNGICGTGVCRVEGMQLVCDCDKKWVGEYCEIEKPCEKEGNTLCGTGACHNSDDYLSHTCDCSQTAFIGPNCDILPLCTSNPCKNGGNCINNEDFTDFTCECDVDYSIGKTCEVIAPCINQDHSIHPCTHNGICFNNLDFTDFHCQCEPGFTGKSCESSIPCFEEPCKNSAVCVDMHHFKDYECRCGTEFYGKDCENLKSCVENPCQNDGNCVYGVGDADGKELFDVHSCQCKPSHTGSECEIEIPCSESPCKNNGFCSDDADFADYECQCQPGFTGKSCEFQIPCSKSPCQNNGTCSNNLEFTDYLCQCEPGFTGKVCEFEVPCFQNPCQNSALCVDMHHFKDYECKCGDGFHGKDCEKSKVCSQKPCKNNGNCVYGRDTDTGKTLFEIYSCDCPANTIGEHCETLDPCETYPCNSSECIPTRDFSSYQCNCDPTHTGLNCEIEIPCSKQKSPCQNNGICTNYPDFLGYTCTCSHLYTGSNCEAEYSICDSEKPCVNNGVCENINFTPGYFCKCSGSFIGEHCEMTVGCSMNPCENGGKCFDVENDEENYVCKCRNGEFYGRDCEENRNCEGMCCYDELIEPNDKSTPLSKSDSKLDQNILNPVQFEKLVSKFPLKMKDISAKFITFFVTIDLIAEEDPQMKSCLGSFISNQFFLTAASCFFYTEKDEENWLTGTNLIMIYPNSRKVRKGKDQDYPEIQSKTFIPHDCYKPKEGVGSGYDIALVKTYGNVVKIFGIQEMVREHNKLHQIDQKRN